MADLTLGQTVARDVLMAISLLHGAAVGRHLAYMVHTGDDREEVFGRVADAVDRHAEGVRFEIEGLMSQSVTSGVLVVPLRMSVDFRAAVVAELEALTFTEDETQEIVNALGRQTAPA